MDAPTLHRAIAALDAARAAAAQGEVDGAVRALRQVPDSYLLADPAAMAESLDVVTRCAALAGFDDLLRAAEGLAAQPGDAHALYDYGYALTERGVSFLATAPLALAVAAAPGAVAVRLELADALERQGRYDEAVTALAHEEVLDTWLGRYLLVFNSLLGGDVDGARQWFTRLGPPESPEHPRMQARLAAMLGRVQGLLGAERLDDSFVAPRDPRGLLGATDLRGWHWAINGSVLLSQSPHGYDATMNGRFAFYNETYAGVRRVLDRLDAVLSAWPAAGPARPAQVAGLPDRSSQILAATAGRVLGLPFVTWDSCEDQQLVLAFTLSDQPPAILDELRQRPAQLLFEHACCWTEPASIAADLTGLLHQVCNEPWAARPTIPPGGGVWVPGAPDDRPISEIAAEIATETSADISGEHSLKNDADELPGDRDAVLALIARAGWPETRGSALRSGQPRDRTFSPGPVPSARFW